MNNWKLNYSIDLHRPGRVVPVLLPSTFVVGDDQAHEWNVAVYNAGVAVDLSGYTISAYITRFDGKTVLLTGNAMDNVATVTLSDECYAVSGVCTGILRISRAGGEKVTISAIRFAVGFMTSDEIVDPDNLIPSLDELLAQIEAMEAATENANAAANRSVRFDAAQTLTDEQQTQALSNIGGANRTAFAQLGQIVTGSVYTNALPTAAYEIGGINTATGNLNTLANRWRTAAIPGVDWVISAAEDVQFRIFFFQYSLNAGYEYLGASDLLRASASASAYALEGSNCIRVLFYYTDDREVSMDTAVGEVRVLCPDENRLLLPFEAGTIASATGAQTDNSYRARSIGYAQVQPLFLSPINGMEYVVYYYDESQSYIANSGAFTSDARLVEWPEGAAYYRIVAKRADGSLVNQGALTFGSLACLCGMSIRTFCETSPEYMRVRLTAAGTVAQDASVKASDAISAAQDADAKASDAISTVYSTIYADRAEVTWSLGGLQSANGTENTLETRIRTGYVDSPYMRIEFDPACEVTVYFYANQHATSYIGYSGGWLTSPVNVASIMPEGTGYVRVLARYPDNRAINDVSALAAMIDMRLFVGAGEHPYTDYRRDVPENIGVLNAILNFKQLADVQYTPLAALPQQSGDFVAGTQYTGLPYSSSRPEAGFVPNFVSLYTYMTALQNPNSYLYTVDLGDLGNINGDTYYGAVCSTSCGYAFNIVPNYTTHQWKDIPGMEALKWQSVYALKLGDTICSRVSGHVVMVTDITRNRRGDIGIITVTEAASPRVHSTDYTPEALEERFPYADYVYYRYNKIHTVTHAQSPFVAVEDETPQDVTYNTALIPRKGDKANWLAGVDVVIDVLEPGSYTAVEVYRDDVLHATLDIAPVITLSGLAYGSYKARLTDGSSSSDWCYWMVVDAVSTAVATGDSAEIRVEFSASNATPLFVGWNDGANNGTVHISIPSEEELASGSAVCAYEAGSYKIRVAFQTEYGVIHSALSEAVQVEGKRREPVSLTAMEAILQQLIVDTSNWASIREAVRQGLGPKLFPIGTQFQVNHSVYGPRLFDVVAHDYLKSVDDENAYTMTIMQHDLLPGVQFDASEAFYYAETALEPGTYHFTNKTTYSSWEAGTYQFVLTQSVPQGGQLAISGKANASLSTLQVRSYASRTATAAIESVSIAPGSDGTDLGTLGVELNRVHRISYGSDNYKESAMRQFLNSSADAGSVWTAQTKFDRPPSWQTSMAGYKAGLDQDFLAVVGKVVVPCSANNTYEAPDSTTTVGKAYTLNDAFYLASRTEIFGTNDVNDGSVLFPFYEGAGSADRIKYNDNGSATRWWLRTPYAGDAVSVRLVSSTGTVDGNAADAAFSIAPVCTIV